MKNMFMIVFLCIILLSSGIYPQEKKIREDMVVINIEIPVRVMENGRPVGNLEKNDLEKSIKYFKQAANEGFDLAYGEYASALYDKGDYDNAEKWFESAVEADALIAPHADE